MWYLTGSVETLRPPLPRSAGPRPDPVPCPGGLSGASDPNLRIPYRGSSDAPVKMQSAARQLASRREPLEPARSPFGWQVEGTGVSRCRERVRLPAVTGLPVADTTEQFAAIVANEAALRPGVRPALHDVGGGQRRS